MLQSNTKKNENENVSDKWAEERVKKTLRVKKTILFPNLFLCFSSIFFFHCPGFVFISCSFLPLLFRAVKLDLNKSHLKAF